MLKWLHNVIKKRDDISIVIPTYKNTKFLEECVRSVIKSAKKCSNFEILLGIDNCYETLSFISTNSICGHKNIKVFFFSKNLGPYIIRNTLAKTAMYENILFFDSDDIMMPHTIKTILNKFSENKIMKFKFYNFQDGKDYKNVENVELSSMFSHGLFLINKNKFLSMNGFFGWKFAADAEFEERCIGNNHSILRLDMPLFYRRYHGYNLTRRPDTGIGSPLRDEYGKIILSRRNSRNWKDPEKIQVFNPSLVC
jgi:glycosyltransferase involved in cell wall biosynthesis